MLRAVRTLKVGTGLERGGEQKVERVSGGAGRREGARLFGGQVLPHFLDILFAEGAISAAMRRAGLRFRRDYVVARIGGRVVASYSPLRGDYCPFAAHGGRGKKAEAAYERWRAAMRGMEYPICDLVTKAVCEEVSLPDILRPKLLEGLQRLVGVYGVAEVDMGEARVG